MAMSDERKNIQPISPQMLGSSAELRAKLVGREIVNATAINSQGRHVGLLLELSDGRRVLVDFWASYAEDAGMRYYYLEK